MVTGDSLTKWAMIRTAFENTRLNIEQSCAKKFFLFKKWQRKFGKSLSEFSRGIKAVHLVNGECAPFEMGLSLWMWNVFSIKKIFFVCKHLKMMQNRSYF